MGELTLQITESNFETEVINSEVPVLIDFWAQWCGPCLALGPTIDAVAEDFQGKIKVGKVNVDENPNISAKYGIRSIPTLLIFANGKVQEQLVGGVSKKQLTNVIDKVLN